MRGAARRRRDVRRGALNDRLEGAFRPARQSTLSLSLFLSLSLSLSLSIVDSSVDNRYLLGMARPREFDRESALERAMDVFWQKGFSATSTDDLLGAMGIGRQSLYNAFGDKRTLYVEALRAYQARVTSVHLARLSAPRSALAGVRALLVGLVPEDDAERAKGCMGVGSVCELGAGDRELAELRRATSAVLDRGIVARVREGQASGEIDRAMDANETSAFVQMAMTGIQVAARGGAGAAELRRLALFAVDRLVPA